MNIQLRKRSLLTTFFLFILSSFNFLVCHRYPGPIMAYANIILYGKTDIYHHDGV